MLLIVYFVFRAGKARWMKWLSCSPIVFLGKISYGLYLYHTLGLSLGQRLVEQQNVLQFGTARTPIVVLTSLLVTAGIASAS